MRVQLGGDGGGLFVLFGSLVTMHALLMIFFLVMPVLVRAIGN